MGKAIAMVFVAFVVSMGCAAPSREDGIEACLVGHLDDPCRFPSHPAEARIHCEGEADALAAQGCLDLWVHYVECSASVYRSLEWLAMCDAPWETRTRLLDACQPERQAMVDCQLSSGDTE